MEPTLIAMIAASTILSATTLILLIRQKSAHASPAIDLEKELSKMESRLRTEFETSRREQSTGQKESREELAKSADTLRTSVEKSVDTLRASVEKKLDNLQTGNEKKLDQMRETVDEKLQASVEKRFSQSFRQISDRLDQVHKGLGEMQTLATGVGDLKKVMEGVKTRGIYGEVQLGAIISDILTRDQYAENIPTKKGTADRVEFAIKMPGKSDKSTIYLPIDSKFPTENYQKLLAAYEKGDRAAIDQSAKAIAQDIKTQAKKISSKYLDPPATTDFGVLFLPTESLFAEVVRIPGLLEEIQQKYRVTIVGPTTLTTLLNSLLLGFRTLAIEQRSSEVWEVLGAVKTQFSKFGDLLGKTREKLEQTTKTIAEAEHRSRQLEGKLKSVESLPAADSIKLIGDLDLPD